MRSMAKKTGINDSSLWVITILLLALAAWMYLRR
jgi:LPXTG-motif cell wall-anchored protein